MYRLSVVAALLLSVAPMRAAEPTKPNDAAAPSWYSRFLGDSKPAPAPKTTPAVPPKTFTRQEVATSLEQEQKVYVERLKFCTRLRQIAVQTNDDDLLRKADDLEQQASDVYLKKTSRLPAIVDSVKMSESALEQKRTAAPTGTASTGRITAGRAPNGRPITTQE